MRLARYSLVCVFALCIAFAYCRDRPENSQTTQEVWSSVAATRRGSWNWTKKSLAVEKNLTSVQFIDPSHGWIGAIDGSLYATMDGGETWQSIDVETPIGSHVNAMSFVSPTIGWLGVHKVGTDVLKPSETKSWLMKTSDGGKNWEVQYSGSAVQISRLRFVTNQEGWVVGSKSVRRDTLQNDLFVLHTTDQGSHWEDVSVGLPLGSGFIEDVYGLGPSKAMVLTSDGGVLTTANGGGTWKQTASVPGESVQMFFGRFGQLPDGPLWVLGGTAGIEGCSGVLATKSPSGSWLKLKTHVYLSDAIFLSSDKVIVAGFTKFKAEPGMRNERGTILYSSDGGRNWITPYPSLPEFRINALALAGDHIWAVGEGGSILRLDYPSKD